MAAVAPVSSARTQANRAFWLKHLHQWHWVSAATCLVGMALFSITGFTLNHAGWIAAKPTVTTSHAQLPPEMLAALQRVASSDADKASKAIPADTDRWLSEQLAVRTQSASKEWSEDEVYVSLPRPGGDAWLTIDLASGEVTHELTERGWIAYFNDLHKGRNAGAVWSLFIDTFAIAAVIFSTTGLLLLKMHATHRPSTWPVVGLGLIVPLIVALLFIH
jgi:hypothetical protein